MFLHLGEDVMVPSGEIIGIFSIGEDNIADNNSFLGEMREEGFVRTIGEEQPRSFILCERQGKPVIYLSPITSRTLTGRSMKSSLNTGRK